MTFPVRFPDIDYSQLPAHWAKSIAFSQNRNAASTIPTPVEPWLIKLLQSAVDQLPDSDERLRAEVKAFIGQESQHFRQHRQFNRRMVEAGYPRLAEFEKGLVDDLQRLRETRSLKFLLAYADGFESLGAVSGAIWFEKSDRYVGGLDNAGVRLWKWHMAEEFEHREVCFKFYHALFGRGFWNAIVNGYFYRVYGFVYALIHLGGYTKKVSDYLLEVDRAGMNAEERARLDRDIKEFNAFQRRVFLLQLAKNFLPWYNPGRKRTPRGLYEYLRQFEPGGSMAREVAPAASARPVPIQSGD